VLLEGISSPADLRRLSYGQLANLAAEIREFIVRAVSVTGGHLGSNLGVVELTLAVHRVFDSPRDIVLWDTGHQAYVHKIVTGRRSGFATLRQLDGLSGYPSRAESEHDWIENSHASTVLSYAHGLAVAVEAAVQAGGEERKVIAIIGDGSMTGGMAFEALNNLGHSGKRVLIILNDNGRSYAPTISRLSQSITRLRLHPGLKRRRARWEQALRRVPRVGELAYAGLQGVYAAVREVFEPHAFFEALGVRYTGPIDGHDIPGLEQALRDAAAYDGPIVVHVLTRKGQGYGFAEDDDEQCLHDVGVFDPVTGAGLPAAAAATAGTSAAAAATAGTSAAASAPAQGVSSGSTLTYTNVFTKALMELAESDPRIRAITAAMPGPTGLLPFQARWPERFFDVGIAEQHAVTMAAGMAMGGLRPVVAVYSTFFCRAFDQANLDVGLHGQPVLFAMDRAGITGDNGPSHHGVLDLALCLKIAGLTIFAPASAAELSNMLATALTLPGPAAVRWPRGAARIVPDDQVGRALEARRVRLCDEALGAATSAGERAGEDTDVADVCVLAVGRLVEAAEEAADKLAAEGIRATVWDVRVVHPLDPAMIADAARHPLVLTAEDGIRDGGAGAAIADAIASLTPGRSGPPVVVLGTPVDYIPQAKPAQILAHLGLDGPGIAETVRRLLLPPQP